MLYNNYAHGGRPHPMHMHAEALRQMGEGEDKVLAHINPAEAKFLQKHTGMDINPHTGLPQFGKFWKKAGKIFSPISQVFSKDANGNRGKGVLPVLGTLVGNYFGGPIGGTLGGAIGGGLSSRNHPLDHMLGGAAAAMGMNLMAPQLGSMFGVNPHGAMGHALNMGDKGGSGLSSIFGSSAGSGAAHAGAEASGAGSSGLLGGLFDTIKANPGKSLLGATALAGTLFGKTKKPPAESNLQDHMRSLQLPEDPEYRYRKVKPPRNEFMPLMPGMDAGQHGQNLQYAPNEIEYYADGGSVTDPNAQQQQQQPQQQAGTPPQLPTPGVMTNQNPLMASHGAIAAPIDTSASIAHPGFDVGNYVQSMMGMPVPGQISNPGAGTPSTPGTPATPARQPDAQQDASGNPVAAKKRGGRFASGGPVMGATGGQADVRPDRIKPGSYILNATDISLLGDGNTENGMHKAAKFVDRFERSGITKDYMHHHENARELDVMLSDGEYKVPAEVVTAIGKGNNAKGAKIIDKARKRLRKQKGVKAILPPKAKDFTNYLK